MKKLFLFLVYIFTTINLVKAQCDLSFEFVNTGTNMTAFFTPPAASSIHDELGDGTIGSFYVDADGSFICAASVGFNGDQIQLAVMADDSTSPEKDGFSSGESINWFYETTDGNIFAITPSPNDNFTINGISFIQSASITEIDCGGGDDSVNGDQCPPLDFDFVNTGSNMTLFITPPGASSLATLGNGTIGVYYIDNGGQYLCGGASAFSGSQVQITAMADDSTSPEKDGFSAGETIVWKFEDNNGNQYNLTPSPQDGFALNGISFISGVSYDAISCAVDVEGCTDANYFEYSSNATIDDGSCLTLIIEGCTDEFADNYNFNANLDDGSCFTSTPGCTDISACNYDSTANTDDGSCYNNDLGCGCDSPAAADGYDCDGVCIVDTDGDGVCNQFEIVGCQDPTAANYDPNATDSPSIVGDNCPPLDFNFTNTGSNMTLFVTPSGASALASIGNGTIGVYYIDDNGQQACGGASAFSGSQVQITAMADDSTSPEKDGFSVGETIVWKFEDNNGNQYILIPSPQDGFALNGISFISGIQSEVISCGSGDEVSCEYFGCTDASYFEYDSGATIDDGSCQTLIIEGCTDSNYVEYDQNANIDDGSCSILSVNGCTDETACNYNPNATTDNGSCYNNDLGCGCDTPAADDGYNCDGTCLDDIDSDGVCDEFEVVGCQDPLAANYNSNATDSGYCDYLGCTNVAYLEFDATATIDNGSCITLIVSGCTDTNAENYNPNANTADGSCEYDLIGAGCQVSFETYNSGTNHTVMIPSSVLTPLSSGDQIGVFFIGDDGEAVCAGSSVWTGNILQIVAFGDDTTTPELDGLEVGSPFLFLAQSGDDVYVVNASFQSPAMANYAVNGLSFVSGLDFELACTVQYLGCTDPTACNYDSTANTNDDSCIYPDNIYDCNGGCVNDLDGDLVCDEVEVVGCQDQSASNYDSFATDPGECVSWEEAYELCLESGGDDGIGQEDVDAAFENGVASVDITSDNQAIADEAYGWGYGDGFSAGVASVIPEDGVSQADLDAAVAEVQANAASQIAALEAQIDNILENCGDNGFTQVDLDQAYLIGYFDGSASITPEDGIGQADVDAAYADGVASVIPEDGIGQADVDAAYADGVASVTPEDGIGQADVDAAYADGVASVDITSDNSTIADEYYLYGFNDGSSSAQTDIDALQVLLDEALTNSGDGSCEPIYIDLLEGWNIMGYTLPNPQDVAATLAPIVSNVQIVKNNSAEVYWPEYSFNGIGDFIPGQGYQIRMVNALSNYTFPDVGGQRIELTPTVPEWVHELPVLNHPNDIRSLVRVVNMLGQQVDPTTQFKGEILLYLYNDGTTEKHIVN